MMSIGSNSTYSGTICSFYQRAMVVKKVVNAFPVGSTVVPSGSVSGWVNVPLSLPRATVHSP